jgi:hypothetical protein
MSGVILNPIQTTNAAGSFFVSSDGAIQGSVFTQPDTRYKITQGTIGATALYAGMAIQENIPAAVTLGGTGLRLLNLAVSVATYTGFTVADQSHALITTPQSQVPVGSPGQNINFVRKGSQVEMIVACSPTLVDLDGASIAQQVSWDFYGQQLVPYIAAYAAATPSAYAYTSSTGVLALTFATAPGPVATDVVQLTGFTGAQAVLNGSWVVASTASGGTILNLTTVAGLGAITPANGTLVAGGGALPVSVLAIYSGNSMTVLPNSPSAGLYNWSQTGTAARILI